MANNEQLVTVGGITLRKEQGQIFLQFDSDGDKDIPHYRPTVRATTEERLENLLLVIKTAKEKKSLSKFAIKE